MRRYHVKCTDHDEYILADRYVISNRTLTFQTEGENSFEVVKIFNNDGGWLSLEPEGPE